MPDLAELTLEERHKNTQGSGNAGMNILCEARKPARKLFCTGGPRGHINPKCQQDGASKRDTSITKKRHPKRTSIYSAGLPIGEPSMELGN